MAINRNFQVKTGISVGVGGTVLVSSGNSIGIGTTTPRFSLDVNGDLNLAGNIYKNSTPFTTSQWTTGTGGTISYSNGYVGIGNINPSFILDVTGTARFTQISTGTTTGTTGQFLQSTGTGLSWSSVTGGVTIVDDTSTNATRYITFEDVTSGSSSNIGVSSTKLTFNPSTGNMVVGGTVTANSDEKLKTNITTISNALDKVISLRGVEYDRIDNGEHQIGLIAQEVEKVIPEVVYGDETKSVAYQNIIGLLIEAIKEQNEKINFLEKKIKELEDK